MRSPSCQQAPAITIVSNVSLTLFLAYLREIVGKWVSFYVRIELEV